MHIARLLALLLILPAAHAEGRVLAVDVPTGAEEIAESLRGNGWLHWMQSQKEGLEILIEPGARGDTEILVRPLPTDPAVAKLVDGLPIRLLDGVLELDGTTYDSQKLSLAVRLPQLEKRTWLVTGRDHEQIFRLASLVLVKEIGARVYGRGDEPFDYLLRETAWLGRSGVWQATDPGFRIDRSTERNDFAMRDAYYNSMTTIRGRWVELRAEHPTADRPEIRDLAKRLDAATADMAARIPLQLERPIQLVIEQDYVAQGRYLADLGEAVLTADGTVHAVYHPRDEYAYLHRIGQALIARAQIRGATPPWINAGAALWLSQQWFGRDWDDWLPRLAAADLLPRAEQLLAEEPQTDSSAPLWTPVAASLIAALPGKTLQDKLRVAPGEPAVQAHLSHLAKPYDSERSTSTGAVAPTSAATSSTATESTAAESSVAEIPFLRGISFAMLNRIDGGYHAPSIEGQLSRFEQLGSNAVSLMPFAYQSRPDDPELKFMNRSPTSETDTGVLHAARRSRAAGFQVLWKPHIWVSHDSWPGDIAMADDAAWATWWDRYRRYIGHHAFLAEWSGSELFSIGVELGQTLERRGEWLQLIDSVRELYSGAVTYSGNWHADYDRVPFWDRLDFVGVDAYFPLAHSDQATPAELAEGARALAERLRKDAENYGKPVILTEIGYAARVGAWVEPHAEGGDYSAEHQALAYRALFDALGRQPWLRGVFAWKAFSADRGGDAGTSSDFRFLGRPAEAVIGDYFSPSAPATRPTGY